MSFVDEVYERLVAAGPRAISLDEIGEAIGLRLAETALVEQLLDRLEAAGMTIEVPTTVPLEQLLFKVLTAARKLGRGTALPAIAEAASLSVREARVALLYGEVLARGKRA